jgi:hypothetical protein
MYAAVFFEKADHFRGQIPRLIGFVEIIKRCQSAPFLLSIAFIFDYLLEN